MKMGRPLDRGLPSPYLGPSTNTTPMIALGIIALLIGCALEVFVAWNAYDEYVSGLLDEGAILVYSVAFLLSFLIVFLGYSILFNPSILA